MCAVVIGPDGEEAMIPLAAKIGRVAVPPPSEAGKPPRKHSCVLSMKVPMPDGVLSSDVVVLVLHKSTFSSFETKFWFIYAAIG